MYGLIGKKVKMSQIFNADGHVVPVTLVQAGPCVVSQVKTKDSDGYNSVQLAFGEKSKRNTNMFFGKILVLSKVVNNLSSFCSGNLLLAHTSQ